jgi:hypothetical protein
MVEPAAAGHRFIVGGRVFTMKALSLVLAQSCPQCKSRLPTAELPDWLVHMLARFDADARTIIHELGRNLSVANRHSALIKSNIHEPCETGNDI